MLTRRLTHRRGGTLDLLTTFAGCRLDEVSVDPAGVISYHFGRLQSIDPRRPGGEVGAAGTRLRQCAARRCRQSCATTPSSSATGSVGAAVGADCRAARRNCRRLERRYRRSYAVDHRHRWVDAVRQRFQLYRAKKEDY